MKMKADVTGRLRQGMPVIARGGQRVGRGHLSGDDRIYKAPLTFVLNT